MRNMLSFFFASAIFHTKSGSLVLNMIFTAKHKSRLNTSHSSFTNMRVLKRVQNVLPKSVAISFERKACDLFFYFTHIRYKMLLSSWASLRCSKTFWCLSQEFTHFRMLFRGFYTDFHNFLAMEIHKSPFFRCLISLGNYSFAKLSLNPRNTTKLIKWLEFCKTNFG